jgi:hypothetical protein
VLKVNADFEGMPLIINAGNVNRPPLPAKVSRKPAIMAMVNKNKAISMVRLANYKLIPCLYIIKNLAVAKQMLFLK